MVLGYLLVSAVMVVSLGRLGTSSAGCACTTSASHLQPASLALSLDPFTDSRGAVADSAARRAGIGVRC